MPWCWLIRLGRPPPALTTYRSGLLRMYDVKAIWPPLGDHAGRMLMDELRDTEYAPLPSKSIAMTALPPPPLVTNVIREPKKPGSPVKYSTTSLHQRWVSSRALLPRYERDSTG